MKLVEIIFIICCVIYASKILLLRIASAKSRKQQLSPKQISDDLPKVSIIIPARNEEDNIANCLKSILLSNYPKNNFEVIVVNDRSEDRTASIVSQFVEKYSNIKLVNLTNKRPEVNLQGKPGALQHGIDAASHDILMMTDADCTVNENWILTVVSHFLSDSNVGMVCSYTNISGAKIFEMFQDAEWTYMNTYAAAGIGLGTVLGCFGNNLSVSRSAYEKLGGYANLPFSVTEDYVLLRAVFDAGYKIYYLCDKNSNVETLPAANLGEYFRQHKRWAIGGTALGWKAFAFVFSSACSAAAFAIGVWEMNLLMILINVFFRILGDVIILFPVFNVLNRRHLKKRIPVFVFMFSLIELILPFIVLNRKVVWKGQVFHKK